MSSSHDKPADRQAKRPRIDAPDTDAPGGSNQAMRGSDQQMGQALRSVYQRTVDEDVPDEMMDLLSKLG